MSLFYTKPEYSMFQMLVRTQWPHAVGFVPEHHTHNCAEYDDEKVFARKPIQSLHKDRKECHIESCREDSVEEVSRKQEFTQLNIVPKHADFNLVYQEIVSTQFLLLNQTQLAKLLKMVVRDARTAEMEGALNLSNALWGATFQEVPINFPCFAA